MLWGILGAALLLLVAVIVVRALAFRPIGSAMQAQPPRALVSEEEREAAIARFQAMIRLRTVSYADTANIDQDAFDAFRQLLVANYPLINARAERSLHGARGVLYHIAPRAADGTAEAGGTAVAGGAVTDAPVVVLMSHYDVVPVDAAQWTHEPFGAERVTYEGEETIWGRGTLDTKSTLFAVMEAVEYQLAHGYEPACHLYLAFSGDEEISGQSAPAIVSHLQSLGIQPDLVLDEGGAIVERVFPGVSKPAAMIGVSEKGYLDVEMVLRTEGGHSSTPPRETSVASLAKALVALQRRPFPAKLGDEVRGMLDAMGRHSTMGLRIVLANLWLFRPLLLRLLGAKGGEFAAMTRTTVAPTKMRASEAFNVIPSESAIGLNLRLLPSDTAESAIERMKSVVGDERIEWRVAEAHEAARVSRTGTRAWETVRRAIGATWGDVIVSPYLMVAATDSRHYSPISEHVLRFSAMPYTDRDLRLIHNHDERIRTRVLCEAVNFYVHLLEQWRAS